MPEQVSVAVWLLTRPVSCVFCRATWRSSLLEAPSTQTYGSICKLYVLLFISLKQKKNHHNSSLKGSKLGWIVSENLSCLISLSEKAFRIFLQFLTLYFNSAWLNVFKHIFFGLFHSVLLKRAVCSSLCRSGHCKDEHVWTTS